MADCQLLVALCYFMRLDSIANTQHDNATITTGLSEAEVHTHKLHISDQVLFPKS